jgi:hypothetical protein
MALAATTADTRDALNQLAVRSAMLAPRREIDEQGISLIAAIKSAMVGSMQSRPSGAVWMGWAFCAALGLAAAVLGTLGVDARGTRAALVVTARLSFVLFWLAYAGGAMAALFGPVFQPLKQRVREFGLAFAAAHIVHIGLVAWLCGIGATPSVSTFIIFGIALFWTYLLAVFSINRLHDAINPKTWWLMRAVGLNYIAYAFALDFLNDPVRGGAKHVVEYLPFAILAIAGPIFRLIACTVHIGHAWRDWSCRTG